MLVRRVVALVVAACAPLVVAAAPSYAAQPEPIERTSANSAMGAAMTAAMDRHVNHREQALGALMQAAQQHAEIEQVRAQRLAALGYSGDVTGLEFVLPLPAGSYHLSAGFGLAGPLWESTHTGLDFGAAAGTPLVAVASGTITEVADAGPYGLRTILTLEDGTEVWYAHQLDSLVEPGHVVEIGEPIGMVGSSGNSTGPHLHLEIRPEGGAAVDPELWMMLHDLLP